MRPGAARPGTDSLGHKQYGLDYAPLRLLIATRWVAWAKRTFPGATGWQNTWEFTAPLLHLNVAMLFLAAAAAFFLVRHWLATEDLAIGRPRPSRTWILACLAAILLYLLIPATSEQGN